MCFFVLNVILNKTASYQKLMRNNIALMHVVHCQSLHLTHDDSSWWTMRIKLKSCFDLHWHYPVCALQWRHAPHWLFISGEPPIFHFFLHITFTWVLVNQYLCGLRECMHDHLQYALQLAIPGSFDENYTTFLVKCICKLSNNCTQRTHWLFFAQILTKHLTI